MKYYRRKNRKGQLKRMVVVIELHPHTYLHPNKNTKFYAHKTIVCSYCYTEDDGHLSFVWSVHNWRHVAVRDANKSGLMNMLTNAPLK